MQLQVAESLVGNQTLSQGLTNIIKGGDPLAVSCMRLLLSCCRASVSVSQAAALAEMPQVCHFPAKADCPCFAHDRRGLRPALTCERDASQIMKRNVTSLHTSYIWLQLCAKPRIGTSAFPQEAMIVQRASTGLRQI